MNTIAAQIDYTSDILKATNDLLEARAEHRKAQEFGNIHQVIDAQVKVIKAELALKDLIEPADYVAPDMNDMTVEPLPDCGETFRSVNRHKGMHPDDPRRGQAAGINAMNRGPE